MVAALNEMDMRSPIFLQAQRSEIKSAGRRILDQFKSVILQVVKLGEWEGQHQEEHGHIIDRPKGRRSLLNRFNIFSQFGGRRRQRQRQVVGTAPAPE